MDAVEARLLARRGLLEPLVVRGLFARALRLHRLQRPEELGAPRVEVVAERPIAHPRPLVADDGSGVADRLTRQLGGRGLGEELRRLDLLHDDLRLRLGAAARLVVAREGEEDDEAEQHGEPGGEDAEDAGRGPRPQ